MYEAYSDYESMMNMAEDIVTQISLERPWRRETMHNLVEDVTGIVSPSSLIILLTAVLDYPLERSISTGETA
ncbi:Lysine--tRNA ligase, chloroplastic/mitochondrial [Orobanche minor]